MIISKYLHYVIVFFIVAVPFWFILPIDYSGEIFTDFEIEALHVRENNLYAAFYQKTPNTFFFHPGEIQAVEIKFKTKVDKKINLNFSVDNPKLNLSANIHCVVSKNGEFLHDFILKPEVNKNIYLDCEANNEYVISVDKNGETSQDHGQIIVCEYDSLYQFKNYAIPFIWFVLFVFLINKRLFLEGLLVFVIFNVTVFAEILNFGTLSYFDLLNYSLVSILVIFVLYFLHQEIKLIQNKKVVFLLKFSLLFSILFIPLLVLLYFINYDEAIKKEIIYACFQTNLDESVEYFNDFIKLKSVLLFLMGSILMGFLIHQQQKIEVQKTQKSILILFILILALVVISFQQPRLVRFLRNNYETYNNELRRFKNIKEKRNADKKSIIATKKEEDETYVVIIGESLNKNHMQLYDYGRKTNPLLSQNLNDPSFLVFSNVYSNHTHTMEVLSLALTEANQQNKKTYYESTSIIEVLNAAEVTTYWLTNQNLKGNWDNLVSVIANDATYLKGINHSIGLTTENQNYDSELIPLIKKALDKKTTSSKVIFVHLMGNHGTYNQRYPHERYAVFNAKDSLYANLKEDDQTRINEYDNSVLYNDFVVNSILELLKAKKGVRGLMYVSDHADDVVHNLGHNSGKFTYEMTQIPFLTWTSEEYNQRYKRKFDNLKSNRNSLFCNDFLYNTILGFTNVTTDKTEDTFDFTNNKYTFIAKDAKVLHGSTQYCMPENTYCK